MNKKQREFWTWFDIIADSMPIRAVSFRKAFEYLDTMPDPIIIVETGCARDIGNWAGDGQSTLLFDRYVQSRKKGSCVYSVDINQENVNACKKEISDSVTVTCSDSVAYLHSLSQSLSGSISMLYLDSFDIDWLYLVPSAVHHLKELAAIKSKLTADSLVMVDDCPIFTHLWYDAHGNLSPVGEHCLGGKGRYVGEYAQNIGAEMLWNHYQTAWRNMA